MARIGLDIGHRNHTFPPGKGVYKNGKGYAEFDFNQKLGRRIKELLEGNDHTVVMQPNYASRTESLRGRTDFFNAQNVDIVLSVHANANASASVNGRCVFYWGTSENGKKLAIAIRDEMKAKGYSTHGNGLHAGKIGSWTNLHMIRETKMPTVLAEHGFMTGNKDFDLIFGNKQSEYIEDMAQADVAGIVKYLGGKPVAPSKPAPSKPAPKPSTGKSIAQMANEVEAGKHGNGHDNRRKSLGVSQSVYNQVRAEVNRRAGTSAPTKKSVSQMATEVIAGEHGSGHANRRKSLGITQAEYNKVRAEVNKRAGVSSGSSKSVSQMATEVLQGKHGNGHAQRQKSLGVNNATYQKVRAEVSRRA